MAIPAKGTRRIVVGGVTYRWRAAYDRLAWDKGLRTGVRIVIQAIPAGQLLVAEFMGSHREDGDPLNLPFAPSFARMLIEAGLAKGWRPTERIQKPTVLDEGEVRLAANSRNQG